MYHCPSGLQESPVEKALFVVKCSKRDDFSCVLGWERVVAGGWGVVVMGCCVVGVLVYTMCTWIGG